MFYGYENGTGYVQAFWEVEPTPAERQGLQVLEVDVEGAPTEGFWRVANGVLVQVPQSFEHYERHRARAARRRAS